MSIHVHISRWSLAAAGVLALGLTPAAAQDYPSRAIDVIVPFNPGGGADASQRTFN
jgi:tripartite-type tricarboxylate transporter receptor subunit TctC